MKPLSRVGHMAIASAVGPQRARRLIGRAMDRYERVAFGLDPAFRRNAARLATFRNKHKGERCFVMGNGPSLRKMDLAPLRDEVTFGVNRVFLMADEMGFQPTYFAAINDLVIEQSRDAIAAIRSPKFLTWRARAAFKDDPDAYFLRAKWRYAFSTDASRGIWEGATVTNACLQLAYHMGFSEVVLIGVDHSYSTKGPAHQTVTSQGADPDHFHPDYFGAGFRWQLPDLETSEIAYRLARQAFEADGRRIVDATVDGKLAIFPKANYADLVARRASA